MKILNYDVTNTILQKYYIYIRDIVCYNTIITDLLLVYQKGHLVWQNYVVTIAE